MSFPIGKVALVQLERCGRKVFSIERTLSTNLEY
jgi:hypothetical protein